MKDGEGPTSGQPSETLRWGLMCTGTELPEWAARCVEQLLDLPFVELSLLIVDGRRASRSVRERLRYLTPNTFLFQLWSRAFMKPRATKARDLGDRLEHVPARTCRVRHVGKYSEYFEPEDVEAIQAHELDFMLRFSFGIIRGEILEAARFGVWSFHHGDEQAYRGAPPCFWEIARGEHVTGAILQRLTDRLDGGVVLKKGYFKTVPYSYRRNLDTVLLGSAHWPAEVCRDLQQGESAYIDRAAVVTDAPVYRKPGNLKVIATWWKMAVRFLREASWYLFREEEWAIQIHERTMPETLAAIQSGTPLQAADWIRRPDRRGYWADPFVLEHEGQSYLLLEDFDYCQGRGTVRILHLAETGRPESVAHHLAVKGHSSYPSIVRYDDRIYCVPETTERREIAAFEALEFPSEWKKAAVLLDDVEAADPTLFEHGGLWWLFYSDAERDADRELCAWYSDDPLGEWRPHLRNPIKIDVRSARPAGPPIVWDGKLFRPSQDCSRTYGGAVVLNRVDRLTPTEFEEHAVGVLAPNPESAYPSGLHTLGIHSNFTVIDAKRFVFVPCTAWLRLRSLPSRLLLRRTSRG